MMDQAFLSFRDALADLFDFQGEIIDDEAGVRSHITECTIEMPIELDVSRDESGKLVLGSTPPMYYVHTTFLPSFHRIRVTATRSEVPDGR
jgi:hypothetical protein